MNGSGLRPRLAALITAVIASVYLLSLSSATAWAKVGTITEFPVPTSSSQPDGITAGPDGNLWFAETAGNKIGRITTSGGITEFPLPTNCSPLSSSGCQLEGITAGPANTTSVWFTEFDGNKIGEITTK